MSNPGDIRRVRLYDQIARSIRVQMEAGQLRPGDRLPPEREMAERLGVSRVSIREALIVLEMLGLIQIRHGSGAVVRQSNIAQVIESLAPLMWFATPLDLIDLMELRLALECESAALAAQRATPDDLERIAEANARIMDARPLNRFHEDALFHFTIAEATHNSALLRTMQGIAGLFLQGMQQAWHGRRSQEAPHEHAAILAHLRARDPEGARQAMRRHLERVLNVLMQSQPARRR